MPRVVSPPDLRFSRSLLMYSREGIEGWGHTSGRLLNMVGRCPSPVSVSLFVLVWTSPVVQLENYAFALRYTNTRTLSWKVGVFGCLLVDPNLPIEGSVHTLARPVGKRKSRYVVTYKCSSGTL